MKPYTPDISEFSLAHVFKICLIILALAILQRTNHCLSRYVQWVEWWVDKCKFPLGGMVGEMGTAALRVHAADMH
jgi:hypothetical protein